ncbi:permease prefix domain 1-containing protein [Vagococcus entomophilus]|uniref:Beta-carotene 15,15'-monooxygenase n=1 Tax=Vagococcus entomophilus TaxID=1160095 RepID=A0A430AEU2_9ENTE|nr:permease prefix domain 1-containing protein [Vagococcus entomophilus]RSU05948.1 hypothetical protein CBF30_11600 [Vagococcus entomophilus]
MKTLNEYIETLFINLPKTLEMEKIKEDLQANMEDKYHDLRAEGKSENEAIGQVIAEFGNIDELLEEMDDSVAETPIKQKGMLPVLADTFVTRYLEMRKRLGFGVGMGVVCCIIGVAMLLLIMSLFGEGEAVVLSGTIPMFLFVAVGVGCFIWFGMQMRDFDVVEHEFVCSYDTIEEVEYSKQAYEKSYKFSLTFGVGLCILSVVPLLAFLALGLDNDRQVLFATSLLLVINSAAIFLFIYVGNVMGSFTLILENARVSESTQNEQHQKKSQYYWSGSYWSLVLVLYFLTSFLFHSWAYSWLIFILASAIGNMIKK